MEEARQRHGPSIVGPRPRGANPVSAVAPLPRRPRRARHGDMAVDRLDAVILEVPQAAIDDLGPRGLMVLELGRGIAGVVEAEG
jgi:hypothetical protein